MAEFNFDPAQHKLQETLEALPPGWYPAVMIESEIVPTAKGDGFRLAVVYQITDGPGAGRKIKNGFNIANPNAQAVEISMSEIKTMQACMGIFTPIRDSQEMHNRPLQIRLSKAKDSDYNEVKGFKTIAGADAKDAVAGAGGPPVGHQVQPPQGFGAPPPAATPYAAPPAPPAPVSADPTAGWQRSPDNAWKLNPATNGWEPNAPAAPAAPVAAPAWAPPVAVAAAAPASYAPPAPATAAAPAWAPQTSGAPSAPAWAPPR